MTERGAGPDLPAQVALAQDLQVVLLMARDDPGERANGDRERVGGSAARPGIRRERAEQPQGGVADQAVLFYQILQRPIVEVGLLGPLLLVEPRERRGVTAAYGQGAVAEHTLRVHHVAHHALDAPLVRRVAV